MTNSCQITPNPANFGGQIAIMVQQIPSNVPIIDGLSWTISDSLPLNGVVIRPGPIDLSELGCGPLEVMLPFSTTTDEMPAMMADLGPLPFYEYNFEPLIWSLPPACLIIVLILLYKKRWNRPQPTINTLREQLIDFSFDCQVKPKKQFTKFFALFRLYLGEELGLTTHQPSVGELLAVNHNAKIDELLRHGEYLEYGKAEQPVEIYREFIDNCKNLIQFRLQ